MRLFTALDLSNDHKRLLSSLRRSIAGVTWYPPQSYHLTLRFIGEIRSRPLMEEISHALASVTIVPFALVPSTVGIDEQGQHRRLWAGVEPEQGLLTLQSRVESALRRCGLPPEKRRFQPRIAVGKLTGEADGEIVRWIQGNNLMRGTPAVTSHFTLFRSHRAPDAPHYEVCAEYPVDVAALHSLEDW